MAGIELKIELKEAIDLFLDCNKFYMGKELGVSDDSPLKKKSKELLIVMSPMPLISIMNEICHMVFHTLAEEFYFKNVL